MPEDEEEPMAAGHANLTFRERASPGGKWFLGVGLLGGAIIWAWGGIEAAWAGMILGGGGLGWCLSSRGRRRIALSVDEEGVHEWFAGGRCLTYLWSDILGLTETTPGTFELRTRQGVVRFSRRVKEARVLAALIEARLRGRGERGTLSPRPSAATVAHWLGVSPEELPLRFPIRPVERRLRWALSVLLLMGALLSLGASAAQQLWEEAVYWSVLTVLFSLPLWRSSRAWAVELGVEGVKFHQLYIVEGTPLHRLYSEGVYRPMAQDEYSEMVARALRVLPRSTVIHRLTGDPPAGKTIVPAWSSDKPGTISLIQKKLNPDITASNFAEDARHQGLRRI